MAKASDHLFDKRVVDRNIRKGIVTRAEYEQWLKALADAEGNAEFVSADSDDEDADDADADDADDGDADDAVS